MEFAETQLIEEKRKLALSLRKEGRHHHLLYYYLLHPLYLLFHLLLFEMLTQFYFR
jgi:hypothetical protein